jgi:hypothetical protein
MNMEDRQTIVDAMHVLHKHYGGTTWTVALGPTMQETESLKFIREVYVNNAPISVDQNWEEL